MFQNKDILILNERFKKLSKTNNQSDTIKYNFVAESLNFLTCGYTKYEGSDMAKSQILLNDMTNEELLTLSNKFVDQLYLKEDNGNNLDDCFAKQKPTMTQMSNNGQDYYTQQKSAMDAAKEAGENFKKQAIANQNAAKQAAEVDKKEMNKNQNELAKFQEEEAKNGTQWSKLYGSDITLTLKRKEKKKYKSYSLKKGRGYTVGELYVNNKLFCYTIENYDLGLSQQSTNAQINKAKTENPASEKGHAKVAIPTGTYKVENTLSSKFSAYINDSTTKTNFDYLYGTERKITDSKGNLIIDRDKYSKLQALVDGDGEVINRKGVMPQILNVHGWDGIRLHCGLDTEWTEGCVILSQDKPVNGVIATDKPFIPLSSIPYHELWNLIDKAPSASITIENNEIKDLG